MPSITCRSRLYVHVLTALLENPLSALIERRTVAALHQLSQ
jgi:hypothetical protein